MMQLSQQTRSSALHFFQPILLSSCWVALLATAMLFWRQETLFLPPYQDQAAGYWTEADFLADTSFDYYRLRYGVNHYMDYPPGPRSYMISIVPTILALLMTLVPSVPTQIVIVRCASFLVGAALLITVYSSLKTSIGKLPAALITLLLATLPSFIVQIEILGMDPPLALLMTFAFFALANDRFWASAAFGFLAFSVKATGQLVSLVAVSYILGSLLLSPWQTNKRSLRPLLLGMLLHILLFVLETFIIAWGDTSASLLASFDWPSVLKPPLSILTLTPDIGLLTVLGAYLTARRFLWPTPLTLSGFLSNLATFWADNTVIVVSWIAIGGLYASTILVVYIPRYIYCILPMLLIVIGVELFATNCRAAYVKWLLTLAIAFNLTNYDGRFYPRVDQIKASEFEELASLTPRLCMFTERSREYLQELRSTISLAARMSQMKDDQPIFAPIPYHLYLSNPAIGYVNHPLRVLGATTLSETMSGLNDIYKESISICSDHERIDPVFIYFGDSRISVPEPMPGDKVIFIDTLAPPLIAYQLHIPAAPRQSKEAFEEWFLDRTWRLQWARDRLLKRASYLFESNRMDRLKAEYEQIAPLYPKDTFLNRLRDDLTAALDRRNGD